MDDWGKTKKEILQKVNSNISKREIFEEYSVKSDNHTLLRRFLASRPHPKLKERYGLLNKFLTAIWIIVFIFELLGLVDSFNVKVILTSIVTLLFVIQIKRFNGDVYLPGIIWFSLAIINSLKELSNFTSEEKDEPLLMAFSFFYISICIIGIIVMFVIKRKVFSHYSWFQPRKDSNNNFLFE
jgi:hypothetical protein